MFRCCLFLVLAVLLAIPGAAFADLTELAYYRLGEEDGVNSGDGVEISVESLEGRDMQTIGDLVYSDDTMPGIASSLSIAFDGDEENYLFSDAVAWHTMYPGFRVGMEALSEGRTSELCRHFA